MLSIKLSCRCSAGSVGSLVDTNELKNALTRRKSGKSDKSTASLGRQGSRDDASETPKAGSGRRAAAGVQGILGYVPQSALIDRHLAFILDILLTVVLMTVCPEVGEIHTKHVSLGQAEAADADGWQVAEELH